MSNSTYMNKIEQIKDMSFEKIREMLEQIETIEKEINVIRKIPKCQKCGRRKAEYYLGSVDGKISKWLCSICAMMENMKNE